MTRPGLLRMLARGLCRRCPWCGGRRAFFTSWFDKHSHCATCGLRWRRGDGGFELGALSVAAMLTLGPLIVLLGVALAITWPSVPTVPLLGLLAPLALALPVVAYPVSYTVWQALDLAFRAVEPDDFDAAHIVGGVFDDVDERQHEHGHDIDGGHGGHGDDGDDGDAAGHG